MSTFDPQSLVGLTSVIALYPAQAWFTKPSLARLEEA